MISSFVVDPEFKSNLKANLSSLRYWQKQLRWMIKLDIIIILKMGLTN